MRKVHDEFATRTYLYPDTAAGPGRRVVGDPDLAVQDSTGHGWRDGRRIDHGGRAVPGSLGRDDGSHDVALRYPVILAVARVQRDTGSARSAFAHSWVFVGAYLLIWTLFGGLAYLGALAAFIMTQQVPWVMMNAARIGGGILVLAGIYQLTSFKRVCLAKCRAPQDFILQSWGKGYSGSFRMGLSYGSYCLGSSWLLFVLLFPMGIMNIAAMALLTILIFAEKCFPKGSRIAQLAALALILYGTLVIVVPVALFLNGAGMYHYIPG